MKEVRTGFTLIEMLVVIGIIAALMAASLAGFSKMRQSAEAARARELVMQVKTALEAIYDADGIWPSAIRTASAKADSIMDEKVAFVLGKREMLSVSHSDTAATGVDRFGILTPWGADQMKKSGTAASLGTKVSTGGTIQDHLLRFKVDLDGDGIVREAGVGGSAIDIRATVAVWCANKKGKIEGSSKGRKIGCSYSWHPGQTTGIE